MLPKARGRKQGVSSMSARILEATSVTGEPARWLQKNGAWPARCCTTRWSLVLAAATGGEQGRAALDSLYRAYWRPLFSFLARRHGHEVAAGLAQAFFLEKIVDGKQLKRLERR